MLLISTEFCVLLSCVLDYDNKITGNNQLCVIVKIIQSTQQQW